MTAGFAGRFAATTAAAAAVVVAVALLPGSAAGAEDGLEQARSGTAEFHEIGKATTAGFGELRDADGIACIDGGDAGAMGIHYVNGDRVGDPAVVAGSPEVLVYEPQTNGRLRLVAVEYVVFKAAWDQDNPAPPTLFGQRFGTVPAGNRFDLPEFYALHAWIWKNNPSGMFADFNPEVTCEHA
jgi:hypothetical protein